MSDFASRLKELRGSRGLTQKQLGDAIGGNGSKRVIQSYELSDREPTLGKLLALADYFECSLDYLCGRSDNPVRR